MKNHDLNYSIVYNEAILKLRNMDIVIFDLGIYFAHGQIFKNRALNDQFYFIHHAFTFYKVLKVMIMQGDVFF